MTDTFAPGAEVRVRFDFPEARGPAHIRTPHYVRGRIGRVVRTLGAFRNPEDLAFARPAPVLPLYHVAFDRHAIWPDAAPGEELLVEIFGHWLDAA
ncbi:MAG: nitrile hydratase subunit beta [Acidisphaera sp.]|nr:nitrile hydratase subunit beta [Acidisphaera sp.]